MTVWFVGKSRKEGGREGGLHYLGKRLTRTGMVPSEGQASQCRLGKWHPVGRTRCRSPAKKWGPRSEPDNNDTNAVSRLPWVEERRYLTLAARVGISPPRKWARHEHPGIVYMGPGERRTAWQGTWQSQTHFSSLCFMQHGKSSLLWAWEKTCRGWALGSGWNVAWHSINWERMDPSLHYGRSTSDNEEIYIFWKWGKRDRTGREKSTSREEDSCSFYILWSLSICHELEEVP